jgi:hypothetical protein
MTLTEDSAIAAAATTGDRSKERIQHPGTDGMRLVRSRLGSRANLNAVRIVRIWLLLLLAVLLPLRSAVAAAMLCPVAETGSQVELRLHDHSLGHEAMDESAQVDHASMYPDHFANGHHQHDEAGQPDKCNLCSAFCSVTPLVGSQPALFAPLDIAAVSFPDLSAPAATFLCGGQDRPPRSI